MSAYEGIQVNLSSLSFDSENNKLTHYIRVYDQVIPEVLSESMINHLHQKSNYVDSDYLRRHEISLLNPANPDLLEQIKTLTRNIYNQYKSDIGAVSPNLYQCNRLEYPVIAQYMPSSDKKEHFHDHADCWHFESGTRVVSVIYYLNDVEEGGETQFTHLNYSVQPKKGRVLIFPSNFMYIHRANPPISGLKYVCICWIHFDGNTTYCSTPF